MGEPEGLREAVLAYEAALMADDVATLDDWFEEGPHTLRGDANGLLVGHDAIAAFRRSRGSAPQREVVRLELRELGPDAGVAVLVVEPRTGGRGLLTQVWRRREGRWRIAVAQVAAPAPAVDARVWRLVGTPLVGPVPASEAGALAGRSVAVEESFPVAGVALGAAAPPDHHPAVAALLAAGARVTGIARTGDAPARNGGLLAVALGQAELALVDDPSGAVVAEAEELGLRGARPASAEASDAPAVAWIARDPDLLAYLRNAAK